MAQPSALQILLSEITPNVYFQPPADLRMEYPCIVYQRNTVKVDYADNARYHHKKSYQVTVIDRDPNSLIPDKVAELPLCSFDRFFAVSNLNHDVYTLFF